MSEQLAMFDDRFFASHFGQIVKDPLTAVVELVANSWDAGATTVDLIWPTEDNIDSFSITDNGHGLTASELEQRWRVVDYNRMKDLGSQVRFPPKANIPKGQTRIALGKNGQGRFGAFYFADEYIIESWKDKAYCKYKVYKSSMSPILVEQLEHASLSTKKYGTKISIETERIHNQLSESWIIAELGKRFLMDPNFAVNVNGKRIDFSDIPEDCIEELPIKLPKHNASLTIKVIDTKKTDKSTKLHGLVWIVNGRMVGNEPSWGSDENAILDGRKSEAKRYTFLVLADVLHDRNAVSADWSGFKPEPIWFDAKAAVMEAIENYFVRIRAPFQEAIKRKLKESQSDSLKGLTYLSYQKWSTFIDEAVQKLSINEPQIAKLSEIMVRLESSQSKYGLIEQLHRLDGNELDKLDEILSKWSMHAAAIVLDELEGRLQLINELEEKGFRRDTDEVHELQPLFEKALWMFGPQYESIEFTSNRSMNTVIRELFVGKNESLQQVKGSRNRPDFVVLPDGTLDVFSACNYDDNGEEMGVKEVLVVELKKPSIPIGDKEKGQCKKYIQELQATNAIQYRKTIVKAYIVGWQMTPFQDEPDTVGSTTTIIPIGFDTILKRARTKTFRLYDRIKSKAPFLERDIPEVQLGL